MIKGRKTEVNESQKFSKLSVNFDNFLIQKTVKRFVGDFADPEFTTYALMVSLKQEQRISLDNVTQLRQQIDHKY